jgi:hypothetical protein
MTTYRLEVFDKLNPADKFAYHLFGEENLTFEQAMAIIEDLDYRPVEIRLIQENA